MKKSLFSESFSYIFISILLAVALLSGIFFISIRRSVSAWNVNRGQRLENLILPILSAAYRSHGVLDEITIHQEVSPFLTSNVFAYVFDKNREPIYIYSQGGRVPLYDRHALENALHRLGDRERPLTAVIGDGDIIAYLAADTLGFSHDIANRRFLQSVFSFIGWGAAIAVIVALTAAYIFSKILSRQARLLVYGLQLLSSGHREVEFPFPQSEEMNAIAESARQLQNQLQKEEQLRRQWAEDIAHDLRTPVSALMVQLEGLTEGVFLPTHKRLEALYKEVRRIDLLVRDLRELNKVESPEIRLKKERIELNPFLQGFTDFPGRSKLSEGEIHIHCTVSACLADRNFLARAINNVLQNALVYREKDTPVHMEVYKQDTVIVFDISNHGTVDPEMMDRFFERLYRGSRSRTEPGSGLGLPITRGIMRAHGGDAIMKQVDQTTHLILTLPDIS